MKRLFSSALALFGCGALAGALHGCSVIANSDVDGKGIGARCESDGDCHASKCDPARKVCTASCGTDTDCPSGTGCFDGSCQAPLKVGALYVGVVATNEGWSLTHDEGLRAADAELSWMSFLPPKLEVVPGTVGPKVDELVAEGAQVIVANSFSHRSEIEQKAEQYPDVKFLTCSGNVSNGKNHGSYFGRIEQAWYVAGRIAGAGRKRLGYLGSFITPEIVRHLNAFTLGAKRSNPDVVVEVRWLGFWFDYLAFEPTGKVQCEQRECAREEWHTEMMIRSGAELIAHQADDGLPVRYVNEWNKNHPAAPAVHSIGNDNQYGCYDDTSPTGQLFPTCLFSVYWNWKPLYTRLFQQIHDGGWNPGVLVNDNITSDPSSSVASIQPNTQLVNDSDLSRYLNEVSGEAGVSRAFEGPYDSTGQRDVDGDGKPDAMKAGERPTDQELWSMCWFVKGVVQKENPDDPASADVDAFVPDDKHPAPKGTITPPGAPEGVGLNCKENQ